ncbi:MAG: endonuclease V [Thermoplasmata archaeon]|nr:endonuclease V [Thermoplasmata archaeon]
MAHESIEDLPDMWKETYDLVAQVPRGMVTTFGEIAKALGDPIAARFVGLAVSRNMNTQRTACRRVVRSDGGIGGHSSPDGTNDDVALLRKEGISIRNGRVQDFEEHLFTDFRSPRPLKALRKRQESLRRSIRVPSSDINISSVAGVDVSYAENRAYASVVVFDAETKGVRESLLAASEARFPYIPTFLAFRELPIVAQLMNLLDDGTTLIFDGHGILHPERFGIASHAGVAFDLPTIGVAKSLLCGTAVGSAHRGARALAIGGRVCGYSFSNSGTKPIYVSPGHGISQRQALLTVRRFTRYRIPEPTRIAHVHANVERRSATNK